MTSHLLSGVRVIEMTEVWAGPMGSSLLGDLGADVVKVESFPRTPAISRPLREGSTVPGEGPPYERSAGHHIANRNKRDVAINIRNEDGAEALRRLIASADVFIEAYSAGTIDDLGFGWERLREINPNLIMLSMPGWGYEGPYRGYVTLGSGLDSTLGHASIRGYASRPLDHIPTMYHTDAVGAVTLVFAIVTGLLHRERTGAGTFIDMSQAEAFEWHIPGLYAEYTMNGRVPGQAGNSDPYVVPQGCYRAAGGEAGDESWVVIAAENDRQWAGVAEAAGHPEWAASGHPWATVVGRLRARAEVDAALAEWAAGGIAEEIATAVQEAGGIAAPVIDHPSVLTNPQHGAREWLQSVTHRYAGTQLMPGFLWRIAPDAGAVDRACALLGEHNSEVLAEVGYSPEQVAAMLESGAIGDRYPMPA